MTPQDAMQRVVDEMLREHGGDWPAATAERRLMAGLVLRRPPDLGKELSARLPGFATSRCLESPTHPPH
jgi:hypothetical protein